MTHTVSETLNLAADLIEQRGWVQGGDGWPRTGDQTSALCIEGGIMAVVGISLYDTADVCAQDRLSLCPAYKAITAYLRRRPYYWNDTEGRTAAEVIEVLRAAALVEAAREDAARESATEHAPALAEAVAAS